MPLALILSGTPTTCSSRPHFGVLSVQTAVCTSRRMPFPIALRRRECPLRIWLSICVIVLAPWGKGAGACVVATPGPNPANKWDAIFIARVLNDVGRSGLVRADLAVLRVIAGIHPSKSHRLQWYVPDGGSCGPPGPHLRKGQSVVVYLANDETQVRKGWMLTKDAVQIDARVRAVSQKK